jgi:glycosyltransferase involved in cell wall biosynthesis
MQVALETSALRGPAAGRGIGRYVQALHEALAGFAEVRTFQVPDRHGRFAEVLVLPARQRALRLPYDVLHSPTAYSAPLRSTRPWVSSILDVIPLEVASHRRTGLKAAAFHRLSSQATAVLTLSAYSATRIEAQLGVPRERIFVAPLPVPRLRPSAGPLPAGLVSGAFAVAMVDLATPDPRKRAVWLSGVGRALAKHGVPLVVAGAGTDGAAALPHTYGVGRVDDARWAQLLSEAGVFVYTSAYEGQGLPPLEAMSLGAPVVAMDNTAVSEVVGGAGCLVPEAGAPAEAASSVHSPDDAAVRALAEACLHVLDDGEEAARLREAGRARAAEFTADRFRGAVEAASVSAVAR